MSTRAVKWIAGGAVGLAALAVAGHFALVHYVANQIAADGMTITDMAAEDTRPVDPSPPEGLAALDDPTPFEEITPLDDDAMSWSNMTSSFGIGVTLFDANADGRIDIYLAQDGRNWTRPTDETGLLTDAPRHQRNMLYLNQGNDENGDPVFVSAHTLADPETHGEAELLFEDFLQPRSSPFDPVDHPGRQSMTAVAADFDGNGLPDLWLGNCPPGMPWSHENTQRIVGRFAAPAGRQARRSRVPITPLGMFMVPYEPVNDLHHTWESARGEESRAANSLYLNLGDADGDGAPEWTDASRAAGMEGMGCTASLSVADIDLDGDLDVYEANVMDPDLWPGGSKKWAGGINALWVNQLAQTGELTFVESGGELDVDGLFDEDNPRVPSHRMKTLPVLPLEYSLISPVIEEYFPPALAIDENPADLAEISWASTFQDVDGDRYPDIWVANDLGRMRLYRNEGGTGFTDAKHARSHQGGSWMGFAPGDFNQDGKEDVFAGNLGGGLLTSAFGTVGMEDLFDPSFTVQILNDQFRDGSYNSTHAILDGADPGQEIRPRVEHSRALPPDAALPNNYIFLLPEAREALALDLDGLHPYEFVWGTTTLDVQNDGREDLYIHGSLYGRGGGFTSLLGTSPGRLLVNATQPGERTHFVDLTAEHQVFNIEEMQYDRLASDGYVYRKSPRQNWGGRDVVYSYDQSALVKQGASIQSLVKNQDILQTAEQGRGAMGVDLNGDGFQDLILRNHGGYDSRRSNSKNLTILVDGRRRAVPSHDYNFENLTNYEPGRTRVFMNRYAGSDWLKVKLVDDAEGSFNRDGIGAAVMLDGRLTRVMRSGQGSFGANKLEPLHFGLGADEAKAITVAWADGAKTDTTVSLDGRRNGLLVVSKTRGVIGWQPWAPDPVGGEEPSEDDLDGAAAADLP